MHSRFDQWRSNPTGFIETILYDPETNRPFALLPAERDFLAHAFKTRCQRPPALSELVFAAPKKSGKTGFAATAHADNDVAVRRLASPRATALANDLEQAQSRVFQAIKRIVEAARC